MTTIEMAPVSELDLLADLDWEPVIGCDWPKCEIPATWMTVNPTCGHDSVCCGPHVLEIRAGLVGKDWGECRCGALCLPEQVRYIPIGGGPK